MRNVLWIALFLLSGCGITDSMQKTNQNMEEMQAGMDQSNLTQGQILGAQARILELLEKSNSLQEVLKSLTEAMKHNMDSMRHLSILGMALNSMFTEESKANLTPPTLMIPHAKAYADEATVEELTLTGYLLAQDAINGLNGTNARLASAMGLVVIAGQMSQAKTEAIVKAQIEGKGRYEDTGYHMLMARYFFLRDLILTPILKTTVHFNLNHLRDAVSSFELYKYIATRSYISEIKLKVEPVLDEKVDWAKFTALASEAKNTFEDKLPPDLLSLPETQSLLREFDGI